MKERTVGKIVWGRVFGLLMFFLVVLVFQWLSHKYDILFFKYLYSFLFANITLIVIITFLFLMGEIFMTLDFPYNIPAPLFNAPGAVLITKFIFQLITILGNYTKAFMFVKIFEPGIYYLVYALAIIIGYIIVLSKRRKEVEEVKIEKKKKVEEKRDVEWKEVGREFRLLGYDIARSLRKLFKKKR